MPDPPSGENLGNLVRTKIAKFGHFGIRLNIYLMPPLFVDGLSWRSHASDLCQSLKVSKARRCPQRNISWMGDSIWDRLPFGPHLLFAIAVWSGRYNQGQIVISTTGCGKSIYYAVCLHDRNDSGSFYWKTPRPLLDSGNFPRTPSPRSRSFLTWFLWIALEGDLACSRSINSVSRKLKIKWFLTQSRR